MNALQESANNVMARAIRFTVTHGSPHLVEVTFRRAVPGDVPTMYELSQPFMADGSLISRDRGFFGENVHEFHVFEIDGRVVACLGVHRFGSFAEVYNVCVSARWQSHGLGRLLVAGAIALLHAEGVDEVVLFSKRTAAWFEMLGFTPADLPGGLPVERLVLLDTGRGSQLMRRSTVRGSNPVDALMRIVQPVIKLTRSRREIRWDASASSLLELIERNGVAVNHLCLAGICGTCSSQLAKGTVSYEFEPGAYLRDGEVLLCVTQPVTDLAIEQ